MTEYISDGNTPRTKAWGSSKGKQISLVCSFLVNFPPPDIVCSPDFGHTPDLLLISTFLPVLTMLLFMILLIFLVLLLLMLHASATSEIAIVSILTHASNFLLSPDPSLFLLQILLLLFLLILPLILTNHLAPN